MEFPLFSTPKIWTISDLTRYIRQALENDYRLQDLWVAGEVSNLSRPSSGHLYFTLKDGETALRCVMWRSQVEAQVRLPREGEALEVYGRISVYEAAGQYQLYAEQLRPAGEGERHLDFLRLKEKLEKEGLFDPAHKQSLPERPSTIGLVTSATGAALQDVLQVLRRRNPLVRVLLAPTLVQGEQAPQAIVAALDLHTRHGEAQVILLVRGGGSAEDLAAFNAEPVVRAIASTPIPIISGIGHETDLILADFAADVRAPSPSAAAELATTDRSVLIEELSQSRSDSITLFADRISQFRQSLSQLQTRLALISPFARVISDRQQLDDRIRRAYNAMDHRLALTRTRAQSLAVTLRAYSPDAILQRGYALVTRTKDGKLVSSTRFVKPGELINLRLQDGSLSAKIKQ